MSEKINSSLVHKDYHNQIVKELKDELLVFKSLSKKQHTFLKDLLDQYEEGFADSDVIYRNDEHVDLRNLVNEVEVHTKVWEPKEPING